jgi:hypothetical protein
MKKRMWIRRALLATCLLALSMGAGAAASSAAQGPGDALARWIPSDALVALPDQDGPKAMPVRRSGLSERAATVRDAWLRAFSAPDSVLHLEGDLEVLESASGIIRLVMPAVSIRAPGASEEVPSPFVLDLGTLAAILEPVAEERWAVVWELPESARLRDQAGEVVGVMSTGERSLRGLWAADLGTMLKVDLRLQGLDLRLHPEAVQVYREGEWNGAGSDLPPDSELPGGLSAERLTVTLDWEESEPGVVSGPLRLALDDIVVESLEGTPMARLAELHMGADYIGLDLPRLTALAELAADPEALVHQGAEQWLTGLLAAIGDVQSRVEFRDLVVGGRDGAGQLRLRSAALETGFIPAGADRLLRDLRGSFQASGWHVHDEDSAIEVDSFGVDLRLDRIAPVTLLRLGMLSTLSDDVAEAELLGLSRETLGGVGLGLSVSGVAGVMAAAPGVEAAPFGLEGLEFGFGLSDLDSRTPGLSLSYRHHGLSGDATGVKPIPEELLPREVSVDLSASNLPAGALADEALASGEGGARAEAIFLALLEHATRLDINEIVIDLPIAGLRFTGHAHAEQGDDPDPGMLRGAAEMEIRGLDTVVESALAYSGSEAARQQIIGIAAILKLASEKRSTEDGEVLHVFRVEGDSQGRLVVNGNDLGTLLMNGAP